KHPCERSEMRVLFHTASLCRSNAAPLHNRQVSQSDGRRACNPGTLMLYRGGAVLETADDVAMTRSLPARILARDESAHREFARIYHQQFYRFFRLQGMPDFAAEDLACNMMTDIPRR